MGGNRQDVSNWTYSVRRESDRKLHMFNKPQLHDVLELLTLRRVNFYHACQLQDFRSYLESSGICSRQTLETRGLHVTEFDTDASDKSKGLWNLVFGNFNDFSSTFHWGQRAVPNPYGPILIKIDCKALIDASDFAVTLRSAGAIDFSRTKESLSTLNELEKIFYNPVDHEKPYQVKFAAALRTAFPEAKVSSLEWSMTFPNGILPIEHFVEIIVDPIKYQGVSLVDEVQRLSAGYDKILEDLVVRNQCRNNFPKLVEAVGSGVTSLGQLQSNPDLRDWAESVSQLDYQFKRYAIYTQLGTLKVLGQLKPPKAS